MSTIAKKRGSVAAWAMMWVAIVILVITPFYFSLEYLVQNSVKQSMNTHNLENHMLMDRIFYSPNSFFYRDTLTDRLYTNTIDLKKFNEGTLSKLFADDKGISFKLNLDSESRKEEFFYNKDLYDTAEPTYSIWWRYDILNQSKPVTFVDENGIKGKGILRITMLFEVSQ